MEKSLYGLTTTDVRKLAYEIAEQSGIPHPFKSETKKAGKDWLSGFLKRNPDLSVRHPQATSLSRAIGFNKPKVDQFFTLYHDVLNQHKFVSSQIWNMDETGITNVQKPGNIIATKGVRQVSKMTSGERGSTVTVICAMSAAGVHIPPMFIFPRKRMVDHLMTGAPPQSVGYASPSGWTDGELFLKWMEHFTTLTKTTKDSPAIIILDGHHSHKTLAAVDFARENGIHLLTLPPHSTYKMQPLDRTFFKSLKVSYNREADYWMTSNPGKRISFAEMAGIFGKAFLRSATAEKAVHGFATCGLWPFDASIFSDDDFSASLVTDEPEVPNQDTETNNATVIVSNIIETIEASSSSHDVPSTSQINEDTLIPPAAHSGSTSTSKPHGISTFDLIRSISPPPKIAEKRKRTRKSESAALLTSSPYKKSLMDKLGSFKGSSKAAGKGKQPVRRPIKVKRSKSKKNKVDDNSDEDEDDEWPCLICGEPFSNSKSRETWLQCSVCKKWAHQDCTSGSPYFICPNCDSDESD
ncbi:hypothetical protein SNE40_014594 [Patella caerulea]|uniref:Zinc finger PHD-type domain-containing protein n=1 Tax=Patella caerulea TaxID=87958 RepID=A0AAN8JIB8_PATCE